MTIIGVDYFDEMAYNEVGGASYARCVRGHLTLQGGRKCPLPNACRPLRIKFTKIKADTLYSIPVDNIIQHYL